MLDKKKMLRVSLPEDHLGYWLRYVSNNVAFAFSQKLADSGVTVAEWIILRQMYSRGQASSVDISSRTGLTQGAISKLIERLLKKGLVVKEVSAQDRRYKRIKLTHKGCKMVPGLAHIADGIDDYFFGDLTAKRKKQLMDLLINVVRTRQLRKSLSLYEGINKTK